LSGVAGHPSSRRLAKKGYLAKGRHRGQGAWVADRCHTIQIVLGVEGNTLVVRSGKGHGIQTVSSLGQGGELESPMRKEGVGQGKKKVITDAVFCGNPQLEGSNLLDEEQGRLEKGKKLRDLPRHRCQREKPQKYRVATTLPGEKRVKQAVADRRGGGLA